ncbi:MAG: CYTH domain-containing protein [Lachnospiraceae bacterium]|nr:CYTH domain-containing protein [Lachnospiraceae bacterium]
MYKTDPESDVYIINANGTTTRLRQIKGIINRQNEECVLYHCREFTEKFYPGDKELISQLNRQFDIQNSVEIEKKYTVDKTADKDGVINKILEKVEESDYSVTELDPKTQEDVYFDTENETLRRNGFSVRIRECGERRCITCKYKVQSESNGEGGQLERYEAERDIGTGGLEQNEEQIDEAVLTLLKTEKYGAADLLQCVKVINNRKKYVIYKDGTENRRADERYELVVDDVLYQNLLNHNTAKEMQIEIELKSRYETRINMKGLTDSIEEISGLESITESKYIRALKLTEDKRVEISAR